MSLADFMVRNQKLLASFLGAPTDDESTTSVNEHENVDKVDPWAAENDPRMGAEDRTMSDKDQYDKSDTSVWNTKPNHITSRTESNTTVEDGDQRPEHCHALIGRGMNDIIPQADAARSLQACSHTTDDSLQCNETNEATSKRPPSCEKHDSCCSIL
jgi:hypothetical protein